MPPNELNVESTRPVEEEALHCVRCGLCLAACPGYRESLNETDSPRARIALVRALKEGLLEEPTDGFSNAFFRCLLCGACTFVCPSGVAVDRILELTRGELASLDLLPPALADLDARIAQYRNVSAEENEGRLIWADNLPNPPFGLGKERAEIAYFVGCVGSFFPRSYKVPQAFVQIFDRAGVDYALLGGAEWCCGYPMFINGELERARDLVQHNVEAVQAMGAKKVVMTCPSCFHFWKHAYPTALGVEDLGGGAARYRVSGRSVGSRQFKVARGRGDCDVPRPVRLGSQRRRDRGPAAHPGSDSRAAPGGDGRESR
jgi:heterodisulfide reductase subunit D